MKEQNQQTNMFGGMTQSGRVIVPKSEQEAFGHQYAGTTPRVRGSDTSAAAGDAVAGKAGSIRRRAYEYVVSCGDSGATTEEIEIALGLRSSTASARRVDLTKAGALRDTGRRRSTTSGNDAAVYVAVPLGGGAT